MAFECVYVIESEESETFGCEEDAVLYQRPTDEVVGCRTGDVV